MTHSNEHADDPDLWNDAGPFIHQPLPASTVDQFYSGETGDVRISKGDGVWWIADDASRGMGQDSYPTLEAAKIAGQELLDRYEAEAAGLIAQDIGLEPRGPVSTGWELLAGEGLGLLHESIPGTIIYVDQDRAMTVERNGTIVLEDETDAYEVKVRSDLIFPTIAP